MSTAKKVLLTKDMIVYLMDEDEFFLGWALTAIRDIYDEGYDGSSKWSRGVAGGYGKAASQDGKGFNKIDAEFLTSLADYYDNNDQLTQKQIPHARKRMKKYANQILNILSKEFKWKHCSYVYGDFAYDSDAPDDSGLFYTELVDGGFMQMGDILEHPDQRKE